MSNVIDFTKYKNEKMIKDILDAFDVNFEGFDWSALDEREDNDL